MVGSFAVLLQDLREAPIRIGLVDQRRERIRTETVDPRSHGGIELQARPLRARQNPGQRVVRQSPDISSAAYRAVRSGKPALLIRRSQVVADEVIGRASCRERVCQYV